MRAVTRASSTVGSVAGRDLAVSQHFASQHDFPHAFSLPHFCSQQAAVAHFCSHGVCGQVGQAWQQLAGQLPIARRRSKHSSLTRTTQILQLMCVSGSPARMLGSKTMAATAASNVRNPWLMDLSSGGEKKRPGGGRDVPASCGTIASWEGRSSGSAVSSCFVLKPPQWPIHKSANDLMPNRDLVLEK